MRPLPEIDTIRRSERMEPLDNRRLRRALDEGTWVKVAPGAFVRSDHWLILTPIERHRVRVHEVARRLEPGAVISYAAAAAEHGIDMLDPWPEAVDVTCGPATGGRSSGVVRRHTDRHLRGGARGAVACAAEQLEIYNRVHDARLFGIRADGGVIFSLVSLAVTFYVFVFFWMFGIDAGR